MSRADLRTILRPQLHTARAALTELRGSSAVGAMSAGAVAVGAAAIGRLAVRRAAIKHLEIDELVIGSLQVATHGEIPRRDVEAWIAGYERAWRSAGTATLDQLFTPEATYSPGPFEETLRGLPEIAAFWTAEREGPDEVFTLAPAPVAIDGRTAVVQTDVGYGDPVTRSYRNLWVIGFAPSGRAHTFQEWAFWPGRERTIPT